MLRIEKFLMLPTLRVKKILQAGGQPYAFGNENTPVWTTQYYMERNSFLPDKKKDLGGQRILNIFVFCSKPFFWLQFSNFLNKENTVYFRKCQR
jgi:hypothetical protein